MKKIYKIVSLSLVFIVTLLTASGCLKATNNFSEEMGEVELISTPSFMPLRSMNEDLYLGYLGARKDFALIVDNGGYTQLHKIQNCGVESNGQVIGCASTLTKLVMSYGIKVSLLTGGGSSDNVLMYYTTSDEFNKFGTTEGETWFNYLTGLFNPDNTEAVVNFDDEIKNYACNYDSDNKKKNVDMCKYSDEMSKKGYSEVAGNAMILLFNDGELSSIITDNQLDPAGLINDGNSKFDDLDIQNAAGYYNSLIKTMSRKVIVSDTTHTSSVGTSAQELKKIGNVKDLESMVNNEKDFLLLVTSDGFIEEKIGEQSGGIEPENKEEQSALENLLLLFNSKSTFLDNCAVHNDALADIIKAALELAVTTLTGAAVGALIGSCIPVIGTGEGAIVGGVVGFFAGLVMKKEMEEANNITGDKWCEVMKQTLDEIEINVPIYHYEISSAESNVNAYNNKTLTSTKGQALNDYYRNNSKCVAQPKMVSVPTGLLSIIATDDSTSQTYNYADTCEKDVVSNIVGSISGSPELILFSGGKRLDEINGRVTSALIQEMMTTWGLKSIGDMYAMDETSRLDKMSFSVASVQPLSNLTACVSESSIPDCQGKESISYTNEKIEGMSTMTFNFKNQYKAMSIAKTKDILTTSVIDSINIGYGYAKNIENNGWSVSFFNKNNDEERAAHDTLTTKIKDKLKSSSNKYLIKYRGNYYVVEDDNVILGFSSSSSDSIIVDNVFYFNDMYDSIEYAFSDKSEDEFYKYLNTIYRDGKIKNDSILSAHKFYVHIIYNRTTGDQDEVIYTHVF